MQDNVIAWEGTARAGAARPGLFADPARRYLRNALAVVGGIGLLAAPVALLGPVPALVGLLGLGAGVALLFRPDLATLLTAFLLYINFPAILTKQHGMPASVAGTFILLLGFPLLHGLVVRRQALRADAIFGLMLAFFALLLLSTFGAVDAGVAFDRVQQYVAEGLVLYWLIINVVREMPTIRRLFWVVLAAACLLTALSLYQDVTGNYEQEFGGLAYRNYAEDQDTATQAVQTRRTWDRAQGPVDEPNRFAQIMLVLVPFAGFGYRSARSRLERMAALAAGAATLIGVALTLSRGAFLALALVAVAMAVLRWIRPWHLLAGALAVVALGAAVTPFFLDRLASIVNAVYLVGGNETEYQRADGAIRGRTTEMLAALHVFRDHPALGVGPGQFAPFYFEDYAKDGDIKYRDIQGPRRAHNLYLEMAAETGALGLGSFLAIAAVLMRGLWRTGRDLRAQSPETADLCFALWLSLFAYFATGMFLHLSYQRYYWFLVAVASAGLHLAREKQRQAERAREETTWLRLH